MAPISASIQIARPAEDVFALIDDLSRHTEWQEQLRGSQVLTEGPTRVGTQVRQKRRVPGGVREMTSEITAHDPPRTFSFRGIDGPVRAIGTVTVASADGGSRLTLELDFEGRGLGRLMVPVARSQARKQVPRDQQRLKELLETRTA
jgi:uncharacterized membrane protein